MNVINQRDNHLLTKQVHRSILFSTQQRNLFGTNIYSNDPLIFVVSIFFLFLPYEFCSRARYQLLECAILPIYADDGSFCQLVDISNSDSLENFLIP